jgi:hypothetical protein
MLRELPKERQQAVRVDGFRENEHQGSMVAWSLFARLLCPGDIAFRRCLRNP